MDRIQCDPQELGINFVGWHEAAQKTHRGLDSPRTTWRSSCRDGTTRTGVEHTKIATAVPAINTLQEGGVLRMPQSWWLP